MNFTNNQTNKNLAWAFAASTSPARFATGSTAPRSDRAVITSVSRQARQHGIKTGMPVRQAKDVLPELRIFVYAPKQR